MTRIVLALGLAVLLSSCGLKGDLERPVPLWGNPPDEGPLDPRNIKKAEEEAKAAREREEAERAARDATQSQPTPMPPPGTPQ
jgi:hypothetical protein